MTETNQSYAGAGVDVAAGDRAVELIRQKLARSLGASVPSGLGGFAATFQADFMKKMHAPLLVTATDGVGTKTEIARMMGKYDTIGLDLVAMVADDIVTTGARPLFMTDYLAVGKVFPERVAQIVEGIQAGCDSCGCVLIGGETAEHPGLMQPDAFDLAGAITGVVESDDQLGALRVKVGDAVLAMAASGIHANGMSLVRKVLFEDEKMSVDSRWPDLDITVGEALITPTAIYTGALISTIDSNQGSIHALAHVTGGGLVANLVRVLPSGVGVEIDRSTWALPSIFRSLAELGKIARDEMERTFNQGIGMFAIVEPKDASRVASQLTSKGFETWQVGQVAEHEDSSAGSAELVGNYQA